MEASVDDLLRIIGEQQVQIRLLERMQGQEAPEQPHELHPMSAEKMAEMREAAK